MCKLLNKEETFSKLPSKSEIIEAIKFRVASKPEHVRGAEVEKIARELEINKTTVYRYLKE